MPETFNSVRHLAAALEGPVSDLEIWMHLLTDYLSQRDHDPDAAYLLAVSALKEVRRLGEIYRRACPDAAPGIEERNSERVREAFVAEFRKAV